MRTRKRKEGEERKAPGPRKPGARFLLGNFAGETPESNLQMVQTLLANVVAYGNTIANRSPRPSALALNPLTPTTSFHSTCVVDILTKNKHEPNVISLWMSRTARFLIPT